MSELSRSLSIDTFNFNASFLLILTVVFVVPAPARAAIPEAPPGVVAGKPVKYHVRMQTKVVIPNAGPPCKQVRVWHALPTTRPWSKVDRIPGITALSYLPKSGKLEMEKDRVSAHVYFEENAKFSPGQIRYYQSDFQFFSSDRTFEPGSRALSWNRYTKRDHQGAENIPVVLPEIASLADGFKTARTPYEFVKEASVWIRENIKYDVGVTYKGDDAVATMKHRRGHCGHQQTIFAQMCKHVGIPYKGIVGLDLDAPNGINDLTDARKDFANNHTWSQVCFPEIGWVEVDPGAGDKCFSIPAKFVQNNTAFQNYAVWVWERGQAPRMPRWTANGNGTFVCDYGVENRISFVKSER